MFLEELLRHFLLMMFFGGFLILSVVVWDWFHDAYLIRTIGAWFGRQEFIFLRIYPPSENDTSMGEMENFFDSLCGVYYPKDPTDFYLEGSFYDRFSFEYHSIGGKIGIFVRLKRERIAFFRSLIEARFPGTRLVESPDPLAGLPDYWEGSAGPYKQFVSADMNLIGGDEVFETNTDEQNDIFPLKTWKEFQKDDKSPIGDPLHQLFSVLESIPEDVHVAVQFITQPFGSDEVNSQIKKRWRGLLDQVKAKMASDNSIKSMDDEGNTMLMFTESERSELDRIIRKINGQIILLKVRVGILSINSDARLIFDEINGYFKQFSGRYVQLYPERTGRTWVKDMGRHSGYFGPWFGAIADQLYWKKEKEYHEKWLYRSLKNRAIDMGHVPKNYSTESLAAMFHFPITSGSDTKKTLFSNRLSSGYGDENSITVAGKPPSNLPM